jgi:hypothetical protein
MDASIRFACRDTCTKLVNDTIYLQKGGKSGTDMKSKFQLASGIY